LANPEHVSILKQRIIRYSLNQATSPVGFTRNIPIVGCKDGRDTWVGIAKDIETLMGI
jgi:hypothetical protein